jgi:hypothetical protein
MPAKLLEQGSYEWLRNETDRPVSAMPIGTVCILYWFQQRPARPDVCIAVRDSHAPLAVELPILYTALCMAAR